MLILTKEEYVYLNIHFQQVFNTIFLDSSIYALKDQEISYLKSNRGIYQRTLTQNTIEKVRKQFIQYKRKRIYIDMNNICAIDGNEFAEFKKMINEIVKNDNEIFFSNVDGALIKPLGKIGMREEYDNENKKFFGAISMKKYTLQEHEGIYEFITNMFKERLESEISKCCEKHDKESMSSHVKLSVFINIKKMMENFSFFCFCVYKLSLELISSGILSITDPNLNKEKTVFVHTMNSVTIGTIISQMFCMDMILVDHLGPYNKLYVDDLSKTIDYRKKYLVVSDVVCMRTELSNAKTILDILGIEYEGCIALVNIIPIGTSDEEIYALYTVSKENNTINYKITTDL